MNFSREFSFFVGIFTNYMDLWWIMWLLIHVWKETFFRDQLLQHLEFRCHNNYVLVYILLSFSNSCYPYLSYSHDSIVSYLLLKTDMHSDTCLQFRSGLADFVPTFWKSDKPVLLCGLPLLCSFPTTMY